ncbi:MAG: polysaccharide biosynthesis C-terminal domain-containing protein [Chitinophagaceae bacterium]|nr:polysaccharide biosynthesis C-terminal domain-containing protein [Chitinophagaceae bacterium]
MKESWKLFWNKYVKANSRYWINLITSFASQGITALSLLLITPFLLNTLGNNDFGLYGLLVVNVLSFCLIADLGYNTGLLRRLIHEQEKSSQLVSGGIFFYILIWPLLMLILYIVFSKGYLAFIEYPARYAFLLSTILVLNLMAILFDVIIQSVNKIFLGKLIRIIKTIVEALLVYLGALFYKLNGVLVALVLVNALYIIVLALYARKENGFSLHWKYWHIQQLLQHLHYSFWYFLSALAGVMVYNAQTFLMSTLLSVTALTSYIMITRFYEVVRIGLGNFTLILFPSISILQKNNDWVGLKHRLRAITIRMFILCVLAAFFLLSVGKWLFIQWSGLTGDAVYRVYMAYTFLILLLIMEHVPVVFLTALKFNRYPTIVSLIQGLLGLGLAYLLIPRYGIIGAVYASLISLLLTSFWFSYWYLQKKLAVAHG